MCVGYVSSLQRHLLLIPTTLIRSHLIGGLVLTDSLDEFPREHADPGRSEFLGRLSVVLVLFRFQLDDHYPVDVGMNMTVRATGLAGLGGWDSEVGHVDVFGGRCEICLIEIVEILQWLLIRHDCLLPALDTSQRDR